MGKNKMSKKSKIITFSCIGAALLVVLGVVFVILSMSPKMRVLRAINNTYGDEMQGVLADYDKTGGTMRIDADISGGNGSVSVDYKDTVDKASQKYSGRVVLSQNGSAVLSADYAGDAEKTYLNVDGVTKGYAAFENDGFTDKFNSSSMTDTFGKVQNYDIDRFSGKDAKASDDPEKAVQRGDGDQLINLVERLFKNAKFESNGEGIVSINNNDVECDKYTVTVTKKEVNRVLKDMNKEKQQEDGNSGSASDRQASTLQLLQQLLDNQTQMRESGGQNGGMMQGQNQFGGMMPGQGQSQGGQSQGGQNQEPQQTDSTIKQLVEAGVDENVRFTFYLDGGYVRAFTTDITFADDESTGISIDCRNRCVSQSDKMFAFEADVEMTKGGSKVIGFAGDMMISTNISSDDIKSGYASTNILDAFSASEDEINEFFGVDSGKFYSKLEDVMEALSVLRSDNRQSPSAGGGPGGYGSDDEYGYGNGGYGGFGSYDEYGGYGGYGNGGYGGYGNGGYGPGMGPGMGGPGMGPGMGMMPGMGGYPDDSYDYDDD